MVESEENPKGILSPASTSTPVLRRARVACRACNARRVKCDAADGQPCWHCRTRQTPCELIESRRGKYTRRHTRARDVNRSARPQEIKDPSAGKRPQMRPIDSGQTDTIHRTTEGGRHDRDNGVEIPGVGIAGINARDRSQNGQEQSPPHLQPPGEPTSLSYVVEVVYSPNDGSTEPLKVHYPIPASIADRPDTNHAPRLEEPVSLQEAFIMPPRNVADQLIQAFFRKLHPAFPVFDRQRFTRLYHQGQASPLVLQTIFFLGFTVGSEELVHTAGYSERATARKTHYLRAKALYDADYENDRMNLVAVLLLFGFWWAGPEDQKDPCHWIGCAIALAQSLGMHRTSQSAMSQPMRSLRKRIWWAIYTRDRHISAAFGRPCRIRDEDCDIEALDEDDFKFDDDYDQTLIPVQTSFHIAYTLEMTKLATILSDILIGEFSPHHAALDKYNTEMLAGRLAQWESQLPDQLRKTTPDGSLGASFWASMIHFSYQNCLILLFRPKAIENLSPAEAECDARGRMAADTITRLAEDLLGTGMIKEGLVHLVPALFSALSVHTIVICRKDPIRRQLAENKSRQCLLALSELASSWPVKIWIAKAFVNLLRRLTVQGSASIINVSSSIANNRSNVALSARSNSSGLHQAHSPKQAILENSNRNELMSQASYIHGPQHRDLYPSGNLPQGADHIVYSSFWASYLDNTFDMDLLLHNSLGPTLAGPLDGLDAAEGANPLQF
ncbi:fungal-specific transcription factor domain-containing protein [Aspergillus pseudonomiae]|nr:fungal-specific transcription factor domain-containing protein [Aspergillus pseudonomiae]